MNFSARVLGEELLDRGDESALEVRRSLIDLRRVNRYFGGSRILTEAVLGEAWRLGLSRFSILDIASGSCGLPLAGLDPGPKRGLPGRALAPGYWDPHLSLFRRDWEERANLQPRSAHAFFAPLSGRAF